MTPVRALTERRKANLIHSGFGRNLRNTPGTKPAGPLYSGYARGGEYRLRKSRPIDSWLMAFGAVASIAGLLGSTRKNPRALGRLISALGTGVLLAASVRKLTAKDGMSKQETRMLHPASAVQHLEGIKIEVATVVDKPANEVFSFWRNLSNLRRSTPDILTLDYSSDGHSHWAISAPIGRLEWNAQIFRESRGKLIAWKSPQDDRVRTAGTVRFSALPSGRTKVSVMMKIAIPASEIGTFALRTLQIRPNAVAYRDLLAIREAIERERLHGVIIESHEVIAD